MTDVGAQIQKLRQQAQGLRDQRARAEHQQAVAQQTVAHVAGELKAEFGVDSVGDAQVLLASLGEQIQQQAAVVSQCLQQAGVPQ